MEGAGKPSASQVVMDGKGREIPPQHQSFTSSSKGGLSSRLAFHCPLPLFFSLFFLTETAVPSSLQQPAGMTCRGDNFME